MMRKIKEKINTIADHVRNIRSVTFKPVCEEELLELLREFARDIWIEVGDISDIRTHYQTFKKLYLKNDFESFVTNQN